MVRLQRVCGRRIRTSAILAAHLLCFLDPRESPGDEPDVACCRADGGCDVTAYSTCVQQPGDPQPPGVSCGAVACEPIAWVQAPQFDSGSTNPTCLDGWNAPSVLGGTPTLAANFSLPEQTAISEIHWWGAHLGWASTTPPVDGLAWFQVGIWSNVLAGTGVPTVSWDRPGTLLWAKSVRRADLAETAMGCVPNFDQGAETSVVFRYDFAVAESERFQSGGGGSFWLSIAASPIDPACECQGDVTSPNGSPNGADAAFVSTRVGCAVGTGDSDCDRCDVDCNGFVETRDVAIVSPCQALQGWANPECCLTPAVYPWGWITRQNGSGPGAVGITSPTIPQVGATFGSGDRVVDTQGAPWKLSFVLNGGAGTRFVPDLPVPEPNGLNKNRYLSFVPPPAWMGHEIAVRVRLVALDRFAGFNGETRWVAAPSFYADNPAGSFYAAQLECVPAFTDWTPFPVVHSYGPAVVPLSVYEIQAVDRSCENTLGDESCFSPPLVVRTSEWGDVVAPFGGATQPNFGDVNALVDKFKSLPTSISRARAQLRPNLVVPGNNISFQDISLLVGAFQGNPYSFAGPSACP